MWGLLGALQGEDRDRTPKHEQGEENKAEDEAPSLGLSSFWSVANAVSEAVKQTAGEVVRSVQETDWKSELSAFTHEVQADAQTVTTKAAEVVTHLPDNLHLPHPAQETGSDTALLGGVGLSITSLGKTLIEGTKEVFEQVTDLVEHELTTAVNEVERMTTAPKARSSNRLAARQQGQAKYSRFEAEVAAMQRDSSTYCDEPEDPQDFAAWCSSFNLEEVKPEIERITTGNAFMSELQSRIVPLLVEYEDFWRRYFYKLHKLQQREEQRQQLAARAKMLEQEVELGWDDEPTSPVHSGSPSTLSAAARERERVASPMAGTAARVPGRVMMGRAPAGGASSSSSAGVPAVLVAESEEQQLESVSTPTAAGAAAGTAVSPVLPIPLSSSAVMPQSPDERQLGAMRHQEEELQLQHLQLDDIHDLLVETPGKGAAAAHAGQPEDDKGAAAAPASHQPRQQQEVEREAGEEGVATALSGPASGATAATPAAAAAGGSGGAVPLVGTRPASSDEGSSSYQAEVMSAPSDGSSGQRDWCMVSSPRTAAEAQQRQKQEQQQQQQDAGLTPPGEAAGTTAAAAVKDGADKQPSSTGGAAPGAPIAPTGSSPSAGAAPAPAAAAAVQPSASPGASPARQLQQQQGQQQSPAAAAGSSAHADDDDDDDDAWGTTEVEGVTATAAGVAGGGEHLDKDEEDWGHWD